jgi:hypothetical protein
LANSRPEATGRRAGRRARCHLCCRFLVALRRGELFAVVRQEPYAGEIHLGAKRLEIAHVGGVVDEIEKLGFLAAARQSVAPQA